MCTFQKVQLFNIWTLDQLLLKLSFRNHFFLSPVFLVKSRPVTLTKSSEACTTLALMLDWFLTFWMSTVIVVLLLGLHLLGGFTTVPCFLHSWITAHTLDTQNLSNAFENSSVIWLLLCSWITLDYALMCCILKSFTVFHAARQALSRWFLDFTLGSNQSWL